VLRSFPESISQSTRIGSQQRWLFTSRNTSRNGDLGSGTDVDRPKCHQQNNKMKAAVRRFSVLTKEIRTHAKLYGTSYRIAFELGLRPDDPQTYWIEKANYAVLIPGNKGVSRRTKHSGTSPRRKQGGQGSKQGRVF
jgi:hypothetical protein